VNIDRDSDTSLQILSPPRQRLQDSRSRVCNLTSLSQSVDSRRLLVERQFVVKIHLYYKYYH
jgi:hypothetical protein